MIKTITKVGNSQGIIFDTALLQLARLKVGDQVNVEVHASGTITIVPLDPEAIDPESAAKAAKRLIRENQELFRRLS